ncbi:hypothetical protein [Sphingobium aquiterrae]|uniref:hypothetical protein n=1 Tax=Sphingobium aquiterrae TaxID=2038656 RepID=UPI0030188B68
MAALPLAACSDSRDVMDELPNSSLAGAPREDVPESRMEAPLARPVTIGEDGPRLDACGALGVVRRIGKGALALRAAPFSDARSLAELPEGARLHVCTRSLDQKWLGVVVAQDVDAAQAPAIGNEAFGNDAIGKNGTGKDSTGAADAVSAAPVPVIDCGVSSPVESRRPYRGPCRSGWVSSAYVALVAG